MPFSSYLAYVQKKKNAERVILFDVFDLTYQI